MPFGLLGVPTQTIERSLSRTASALSVVARRLPFATPSAIIVSTSFSTTGLIPLLIRATLSGLASTPMTSWPFFERQAAETAPT